MKKEQPGPTYRPGQRVGNLVLLARRRGGWSCWCACGELKLVRTSALPQGRVRKCGCPPPVVEESKTND